MRPADSLTEFVSRYSRLTVLTGAGCSTASGIPDYRDAAGNWKHARPVQFADFVSRHSVRQRYWARSMLGWPRMEKASPNTAHNALAYLERAGYVVSLITQNVDGLHQKAGSENVIDLHGRLDCVACLECDSRLARNDWQQTIRNSNPDWANSAQSLRNAPDGDAIIDTADYSGFDVPPCPACGGVIKPEVVFFGEPVPKARVAEAFEALDATDALLVVGSSLIVYSGYRFARRAAEHDKPIAILNLGFNRADDLATLKLDADCGEILVQLADRL